MRKLNLPVGVSDFEEIRKNDYYYIDKTGLIDELLSRAGTKVTLITRPRRFGKTLGMSMLESFFDIRRDSRRLFEGLEIIRHGSVCDAWMNQYPTISISFRQIDGLHFVDAYRQLVYEIALLYQKHAYLLESQEISEREKILFQQISDRKAEKTDVLRSLQFLTQLMNKHYNRKVVLLIDEYDVPVAKANSNGYYEEMLDVMKGLMQALKDNSSLRFAVITGCLKIAKESIFTGTNNFVSDTITNSRLNEYFGFGQAEVDQLLKDADLTEQAESIRKWYDGYHFGTFDVYCPWDVMNYIQDLQHNPKAKPVSYWRNTSDNAIIRSFIDYAGSSITKKLEILMNGGSIVQHIDENLTYDYLHASEDNLWSALYLTGYLTEARRQDNEEEWPDGMVALVIPNEEIKEIFETAVIKWFDDSTKKWNRNALFNAVWNGDSEGITREMNILLRRTISYHDYREDFYHAFLAGIFTGAGYMVDSNKEHGEGRISNGASGSLAYGHPFDASAASASKTLRQQSPPCNVVVYDSVNGRVAIFEAKYTKTLDHLENECDEALRQIDERMYAKEYEDDYDQILCYGIAFFKKRCMVKSKNEYSM